MNINGNDWGPSPREQHLLWYLRLITRYIVGVGGLVWAMLTNHLEPVLLMILGAVATSTDVLMFARDLIRTAKEENRVLKREWKEEEEKDSRSTRPRGSDS